MKTKTRTSRPKVKRAPAAPIILHEAKPAWGIYDLTEGVLLTISGVRTYPRRIDAAAAKQTFLTKDRAVRIAKFKVTYTEVVAT